MDANPFTILGLDRQFIIGLSDEQLKRVVEFSYRGLQQLFHPDKPGGDTDKSARLNWAKEQLADPQLLKLWKKQYLSSQKRNRLLEEVEMLRGANHDYFYGYLVPHFTRLCTQLQSGFAPDLIGLGQETIIVRRPSHPSLESLSAKSTLWEKSGGKGKEWEEVREEHKEKNAFRLRHVDGCWQKKEFQKDFQPYRRLPIGTLRRATIMDYFDKKASKPMQLISQAYRDYNDKSVPPGDLTYKALLEEISPIIFAPTIRFLSHDQYPYEDWPYLVTVAPSINHGISFHVEGTLWTK